MPRYLYLLFIFIILGNSGECFANKPVLLVHRKSVLVSDSSSVNVRSFDTTALRSYSNQPEFKYDEIDAGPSLWTRFWRWFWHLFDFLSLKIHPSDSFFKVILVLFEYLIIGLALAAIIFFIFKLAGMDILNIWRKKSRSADLAYSESLENIHEINFDDEIEKAIASHNYRLAVRLLYLKCLKQLSDASLIAWTPEKTNSAYINELSDAGQRLSFKVLTRQFEYVWYGEFYIDDNVFKNINLMFQQFKNDVA